jgi:hypothetical protein
MKHRTITIYKFKIESWFRAGMHKWYAVSGKGQHTLVGWGSTQAEAIGAVVLAIDDRREKKRAAREIRRAAGRQRANEGVKRVSDR